MSAHRQYPSLVARDLRDQGPRVRAEDFRQGAPGRPKKTYQKTTAEDGRRVNVPVEEPWTKMAGIDTGIRPSLLMDDPVFWDGELVTLAELTRAGELVFEVRDERAFARLRGRTEGWYVAPTHWEDLRDYAESHARYGRK